MLPRGEQQRAATPAVETHDEGVLASKPQNEDSPDPRGGALQDQGERSDYRRIARSLIQPSFNDRRDAVYSNKKSSRSTKKRA